jgi:hypothetical protein
MANEIWANFHGVYLVGMYSLPVSRLPSDRPDWLDGETA